MDDIVAKAKADLYDTDFYAWTQEQARLLRMGKFAHADLANITEEIETLGRREVSELRSRLTVLVQHLLKESYQPEKATRSWALTIVEQRRKIARHLTENPSLGPKAAAIYDEAYEDARHFVMIETGLAPSTVPTDAPFKLDEALSPLFWPGLAPDERN